MSWSISFDRRVRTFFSRPRNWRSLVVLKLKDRLTFFSPLFFIVFFLFLEIYRAEFVYLRAWLVAPSFLSRRHRASFSTGEKTKRVIYPWKTVHEHTLCVATPFDDLIDGTHSFHFASRCSLFCLFLFLSIRAFVYHTQRVWKTIPACNLKFLAASLHLHRVRMDFNI